jgi:hypothetical protein
MAIPMKINAERRKPKELKNRTFHVACRWTAAGEQAKNKWKSK